MPAITFDSARQIVLAYLFGKWTAPMGTLIALKHGFEDEDFWRVLAGAKEALVDGDDAYQIMDAPAFLVDKVSGELLLTNVITHLDELDSMTPVGSAK